MDPCYMPDTMDTVIELLMEKHFTNPIENCALRHILASGVLQG